MGASRRRRRARLRAALRRRLGQEGEGHRAAQAAGGRRRAAARDGRGPRGRGDRLAPARGAEAQGARPPDGLPRDHAPGDRARAGGNPPDRRAAGRRAGDPAHPRPAVRLRGLARPVAQDHERPLGGPRPVRGDAPRRPARARADGLRSRRLVGHRGHVRSRELRRRARRDGRQAAREGPRLRERRPDQGRCATAAGRGGGARARRTAGRGGLLRQERRAQAVPPPPERSIHDLDPPAGGEPQAALHLPAHDAGRPAPVRERLHHLHAHRLDHAFGRGPHRGARPGARAVRPGVRARAAAPLRPQGQERAGSARGHPAGRRRLPHAAAGRARAGKRRVSACTS